MGHFWEWRGIQLTITLNKHKVGHMVILVLRCILCQIFLKAISKQRRFLSRSDSITCAFKKTNFESNEDYKDMKLKKGNWLGGCFKNSMIQWWPRVREVAIKRTNQRTIMEVGSLYLFRNKIIKYSFILNKGNRLKCWKQYITIFKESENTKANCYVQKKKFEARRVEAVLKLDPHFILHTRLSFNHTSIY